MKQTFIMILVLAIYSNFATAKSEKEFYIESAQQFQRWCKLESQRHFKKRKITPYNWSATTYRELNDYLTEGSWKVGRKDVDVQCQIRIGKKAKHIKIEYSSE